MMASTTDTSLPSLCQKLTEQSRCFKDPRRLVAPVFLLIIFVCLIVISILNVNYLFLGYFIFISAIIITGGCETVYRSAITCQGSVFTRCSRTTEDEEAPPLEDDEEQDGQPESITAWANRSMGITSGAQDNDDVTLVVPTTDASTAPPCYNDIILHEEPPPSYEDFMGKVDVT